jgi:heme/copper-type cytochrome/quinol oxidase subunit 2
MKDDRAANAATAQYPAANQKAQDPAMIIAFVFALVLIVIVIVVLVFVFVILLTMLAQEVGKKQAADAAATQQPARNQELQDTMLLVTSLLAFLTRFLAFFMATAFTHQVCEKQTPHTPTAQAATDCQFVKFFTHDTFSLCSG